MSQTYTSVSVCWDRMEAVAVSYNSDGVIVNVHRVELPEATSDRGEENLPGLSHFHE